MATIEIVQIKSEPEDDNSPTEGWTQETTDEADTADTSGEQIKDASHQAITETNPDISSENIEDFNEKPIAGEFISPLELLRQHMTEPAIASSKKNIKTIKVKKKEDKVNCQQCNKEFANRSLLHSHARIHVEGFPFSCSRCGQRFKVKDYLLSHVRRVHAGIRKFVCDVCGRKFQSSSGLKGHKRLHTGERPFECDVCGKTFNRSHILKSHKLTHTVGEKKFKCDICEKSFNRDSTLNSHMLIHTNKKPFECSFCEYACRDISTLKKHEANVHMGIVKLFHCKLCSSRFKRKSTLKVHVAERHLDLDVRVLECEICHHKFKTRQGLTKHIDTMHNKLYEYQCQICDKKFSNKNNMSDHLRRHDHHKPFVCELDHCGKAFKTKSDLSRHAVIHDTRKHFPCPTCGRLFSRRERMLRHTRTHRPRWRDTPCPHCDSTFYNESYLAKHIRYKHERREVFECDHCGLVSGNKPGLLMHIRQMHLKTKDLKCDICYKKFKNITPLKMHYWTTHRIRKKLRQRNYNKKKDVEIKQEIIEVEDRDLEKDVLDKQLEETNTPDERKLNANLYKNGQICETAAKSLIRANCRDLRRVPEAVFDQLYLQTPATPVTPTAPRIDSSKDNSNDYRQLSKCLPMAKVFIQDIFYSRKRAKIINYKKMHNGDYNGLLELKKQLNKKEIKRKEVIKEGLDQIVIKNVQQRYGKHYQIKINLVQCPICMKLFATKEILAEHTSEHHPSSSASENDSETESSKTPEHLNNIPQTISKTQIKTKINKKRDKHKVRDKIIKKKEEKNKVVLKSRLVRKGNNWIVENLTQKVNEEEVQEIINNNTTATASATASTSATDKTDAKEDLTKDTYLDNLKAMGVKAKQEGKRMLYPCDKCPKVCLAFCGIKLHRRVHNTQAKPFKQKIWKHKMKNIKPVVLKPVIKKINNAKPQPIKHKHKCDEKLKEFYQNCIRGSNIEFEQFLKIFNKIDRENVNEFGPIEKGREFNENNYATDTDKNKSVKSKSVKNITTNNNKHRVLNNLNRKLQLERINKINELRRNIKNRS